MSEKPTGLAVAQAAVALWQHGYTYDQMDCQAFVRRCIADAGGSIAYKGVNTMVRNCNAWLGTLDNAKASGKLVPGALLFINEEVSASTPAKYRGDGLGDFTHVGIYIGDALSVGDVDKNGKQRTCNVIHSSSTMQRVAGSTLANGWTHVGWMPEIDCGAVSSGVTIGAELSADDVTKDEGASAPAAVDVSCFVTVKRGCRGGAVRRLQTWLCDIGFSLEIDGIFGAASQTAVKQFQQLNGLTVDGIVGQKTWQALADCRANAAAG